jgi:BirA family biotin operon repressor/biotin-[acetyl-CoA-carboxylase] ligase
LIETDGTQNEFLIIGMGVNLRHAPPDDAVRTPAAALWPADAIDPDRDRKFAEALLENFTAWHARYAAKGFEPIRAEWLRHAHNLHQSITVTTPTETHNGIFNGIDEYGNLLLTQGPRTRKITTADVS